MNSREQLLAKRVAALEARLQASMVVIDYLIKDLEFTESVGAAFAFDLGSHIEGSRSRADNYYDDGHYNGVVSACDDIEGVQSDWDKAVAALEAERAK